MLCGYDMRVDTTNLGGRTALHLFHNECTLLSNAEFGETNFVNRCLVVNEGKHFTHLDGLQTSSAACHG